MHGCRQRLRAHRPDARVLGPFLVAARSALRSSIGSRWSAIGPGSYSTAMSGATRGRKTLHPNIAAEALRVNQRSAEHFDLLVDRRTIARLRAGHRCIHVVVTRCFLPRPTSARSYPLVSTRTMPGQQPPWHDGVGVALPRASSTSPLPRTKSTLSRSSLTVYSRASADFADVQSPPLASVFPVDLQFVLSTTRKVPALSHDRAPSSSMRPSARTRTLQWSTSAPALAEIFSVKTPGSQGLPPDRTNERMEPPDGHASGSYGKVLLVSPQQTRKPATAKTPTPLHRLAFMANRLLRNAPASASASD